MKTVQLQEEKKRLKIRTKIQEKNRERERLRAQRQLEQMAQLQSQQQIRPLHVSQRALSEFADHNDFSKSRSMNQSVQTENDLVYS
jgi:hypothetical protein